MNDKEQKKDDMELLADYFIEKYGITDEMIDHPLFGLFDHVTGRSLVRGI